MLVRLVALAIIPATALGGLTSGWINPQRNPEGKWKEARDATLCDNRGKLCACVVNGCGGSDQASAWRCSRWKNLDCNVFKGTETQHSRVGRDNAFRTYGWGDNYAVMLEGFVKFPETRNYRFNQYSDDSGFFAIAKDPVKDGALVVPKWEDMRVVVEERGCCRRRWGNWIKGIQKDEIYYVRAWYKEGGGGDYGYFGWDYSRKATGETIPLDYFVVALDEQVKALPSLMGRLNTVSKDVDEISTQVKDLPLLKKSFDAQKKSFDDQMPKILDDRQTLKRKADDAVVSAEMKSLGQQMDQLEVKLTKSESRLEDKVQVSTTKADNAVSSVRSDLDKFKQEDFNKVKQDTRDDLKTLRDDMELDVEEKVQGLQERVSSQEKMLGDFKSNLIGAINNAASARLDGLVVDIAPPTATAPRIFTSDNGRLNFETTHERVTVNEVEIPNVDDVVSTVNAGVATGFNYLADAMKGL